MVKLSEALLLAETFTTAAHGTWIKRDDEGKQCGGCAVGRACMAVGFVPKVVKKKYVDYYSSSFRERMRVYYHNSQIFKEDTQELSTFFDTTWPWTKNATVKEVGCVTDHLYVGCMRKGNPVMMAISALYETYGLSMQCISKYIASLEPKDEVIIEQPTEQPTYAHLP